MTSELVLAGPGAKRLALSSGKAVVVASGSRSRATAGTTALRVAFKRAAKPRLMRQRTVTLTLRTTVRDAAGNARTVSRAVRLRR